MPLEIKPTVTPTEPTVTPPSVEPTSVTPSPSVEPTVTPPPAQPEGDTSPTPPVPESDAEIPPGIDFSDFPGVFTPPAEIAAEAKRKADELAAKPPVVTPPVVPPVTTPPGTPVKPSRDLTDLPPQIAPLFKEMSNEAFEKLKPLVLEHVAQQGQIADLKKARGLPESYWEHEQGYTLAPEFGALAQDSHLASIITNHWKEQLKNVKAGKDWQVIDINDKGDLFLHPPKAVKDEDEGTVIAELMAAQQQSSTFENKVREFAASHKVRYQTDLDSLRASEKKYFAPYQDPNHPMQKVIGNVKNIIPPAFRKSPLADIFAYVVANNVQLRLTLDQLNAKKATTATAAQDAADIGPTQRDINIGGKPPTPVVDFKQYEELLQRQD